MERKTFDLSCAECGKGFTTWAPNKRYCSKGCELSFRRNRYAAGMRGNAPEETRACATCGKVFTTKISHKAHCSAKCRDKSRYEAGKEVQNRRKVTRMRIGLNIRDETMKTPSRDAKWLWDGIGKWSTKYWPDVQQCLECNTSVYRHYGLGVCEKCADSMKQATDEQKREWRRKSYEKRRELGKKSSQDMALEWIDRARRREIPMSQTVVNLLDNLDRL